MSASTESPAPPRILLVTGLSGAGRTTTLRILEDLGYEAIDNLPLGLLPALVGSLGPGRCLAVGVDVRTRGFRAAQLSAQLSELRADPRIEVQLLFLDCDDEMLRRRFTETRRLHPLATDRPVTDGIRLERSMVTPLREVADRIIDTSHLPTGELKVILKGHFAQEQPGLGVFVTSFAFRHGLPLEADLVFDARFLRNPHYEGALRPLTGLDPEVGAFVSADPAFEGFLDGVTRLIEPLLPRYEQEGKSYLTIAVGCTGGRHRSVYVAGRLDEWLRGQGHPVTLRHRDLGLSA